MKHKVTLYNDAKTTYQGGIALQFSAFTFTWELEFDSNNEQVQIFRYGRTTFGPNDPLVSFGIESRGKRSKQYIRDMVNWTEVTSIYSPLYIALQIMRSRRRPYQSVTI